MKKVNRKNKTLFLFVTLVMLLAILPCTKAKAAETISKGKTYTYHFSEEGETKNLRFIMPAKGYVYFEVCPTASTDTYGRVELTISNNYKQYENNSIYYGDGVYRSNKYGFKKGAVINVDIESLGYDWVTECTVKPVVVVPKNFETESNNSKKKADTIKSGKTYNGLIMQEDSDWFVFKAPKTGTYKVYGVSVTEGETTYMRVYKNSKEINGDSVRYGDGWNRLAKIKLKKNQKLYIKVTGNDDFTICLYKIKVKR